MSHKSRKISELIEGLPSGELDAHYLGYFECFNRQLYFEAHEVLEELWLGERGQPEDLFYKGLIQLAGAFVHLQKKRLGPAAALFRLAKQNLQGYPSPHQQLKVSEVVVTINLWLDKLASIPPTVEGVDPGLFPKINLGVGPGPTEPSPP